MVTILRLKSFFCVSILLSLILLSGCAHNQPGAKPGLFDNLVNTFNPFSSQEKRALRPYFADFAVNDEVDKDYPFEKIFLDDTPDHSYAYKTTYEPLLLSAFNHLQGFDPAHYVVDFRNTFYQADDALPKDNTKVTGYIEQQMKMLKEAEFGITKKVTIHYVTKEGAFQFYPVSPYEAHSVINFAPSHGQGKLPDKITYQFVNATQIIKVKLPLKGKVLGVQTRRVNIIFHIVGIIDNDIAKVRAKIDTIQLYKYDENYNLVLEKTIQLP